MVVHATRSHLPGCAAKGSSRGPLLTKKSHPLKRSERPPARPLRPGPLTLPPQRSSPPGNCSRNCSGNGSGRLRRGLGLALLLAAWALPGPAWDADLMRGAALRVGPGAVAALPALQALLRADGPQGDAAWLDAVNGFFNRRLAFQSDALVWGVEDHWASPLEALDKAAGDCEDYAIAKFFTLLAAGVPGDRLRLVYVRALRRLPAGATVSEAHMVLAYYPQPGADPLVLDNLRPEILPASRRTDLTPVFSFNHVGLWMGAGAAPAGDPLARLSRWREVLAKARAEGFL